MPDNKCTCYGRVMCPFCSARHSVDSALREFEEEAWQWKQNPDHER